MAKSTSDLLAAIRRSGFVPDASDQSDADWLALADQELETLISEAVVSGRGEHWFKTEDTLMVPGTTSYRLPRRLLGRSVRAVTAVPAQANAPEYQLYQVDPIELRGFFPTGTVANPAYFAFEGDFIKLGAVPVETGWYLRVHYICRPSKLAPISTTEMARIYTAISTTQVRIIETSPGTNLTEFGALLDIVRGSEPYDVIYQDLLSNDTFSAPAFNFQSSTPIVVADFASPVLSSPLHPGAEPWYLCQRGQTPLPPIPSVMWTALVYSTLAAGLAATRDPGAAQMGGKAEAAKAQAVALMEPRDERQSEVITNQTSLLRVASRRRRW